MKTQLPFLALFLSVCCIAAADEPAVKTVDRAANAADQQRYLVTLSEYRLPDQVPASWSDSEIVSAIKKEDLKPVETLRLSTLSGNESLFQIGRRVSVITGKVVNREHTSNIKQSVETGTQLQVTASPHEIGVQVKIAYETSRFDGEGSEDSPPDTVSITCSVTQTLQLDKPTLIGASSSRENSYLILTVSKAN